MRAQVVRTARFGSLSNIRTFRSLTLVPKVGILSLQHARGYLTLPAPLTLTPTLTLTLARRLSQSTSADRFDDEEPLQDPEVPPPESPKTDDPSSANTHANQNTSGASGTVSKIKGSGRDPQASLKRQSKLFKQEVERGSALRRIDLFQKRGKAGLDSKTYSYILDACVTIGSPKVKIVAFEVYDDMVRRGCLIASSHYKKLLKVCADIKEPYKATHFAKEYRAKGLTEDRMFFESLIEAYTTKGFMDLAVKEYLEATNKDIIVDGKVLDNLVINVYTTNHLSGLVDSILKHHSPGPSLSMYILNASLHRGDNAMIGKMLSHIQDNLKIKLGDGVLNKALACGARAGNVDTAMKSISMLEGNGFEIGYFQLRALVIAAFRGSDDVTGVMTLQEMSKKGYVCDWYMVSSVGISLMSRIRRLDNIYYALCDMQNKGELVPAAALQIIIMACGMGGQIDRAFATFDEYSSIFNLPYDVQTYNTLLYATTMSKYKKVQAVSSIIQRMQATDTEPDARSYELLIKSLVEGDQPAAAYEILQYMQQEKIAPTELTLRMCAREFAKAKLIPQSIEAERALRQPAPTYLTSRLEHLRNSTVTYTNTFSQYKRHSRVERRLGDN